MGRPCRISNLGSCLLNSINTFQPCWGDLALNFFLGLGLILDKLPSCSSSSSSSLFCINFVRTWFINLLFFFLESSSSFIKSHAWLLFLLLLLKSLISLSLFKKFLWEVLLFLLLNHFFSIDLRKTLPELLWFTGWNLRFDLLSLL